MSTIANFIPVLWSKKILRQLDKEHMLVKNCTTEYSGEIQGVGSKVKINSVQTPTIGDYVEGATSVEPEAIRDESRMLEITQAKYFAFKIGKIEKKQTTNGVLEEALRLATIGLKDASEVFIASKYVDADESIREASLTSGNFFSVFMKAKRKLMRNNVKMMGELCVEVTPEVWEKGVLADILFNNSTNGEQIKKGYYVESLGMRFFVSNNISITITDENVSQSFCVVRTKQAIAYAEQIMDVDRYKIEKGFGEAIKGLHVYGAKMVKPKEAIYMDLKTAAETVI